MTPIGDQVFPIQSSHEVEMVRYTPEKANRTKAI